MFGVLHAEESTSNEKREVEINKALDKIDSKYEVGEVFSTEDTKLLEDTLNNGEPFKPLNSQKGSLSSLTNSWNFFGTDRVSTSGGYVEGDVSGTLTATLGYINHSTRWDIKAEKVRGSVSQTRARGTIVGYGVVGSDGVIGKIVDTGVSSGYVSGGKAFTEHGGFFLSNNSEPFSLFVTGEAIKIWNILNKSKER